MPTFHAENLEPLTGTRGHEPHTRRVFFCAGMILDAEGNPPPYNNNDPTKDLHHTIVHVDWQPRKNDRDWKGAIKAEYPVSQTGNFGASVTDANWKNMPDEVVCRVVGIDHYVNGEYDPTYTFDPNTGESMQPVVWED